MRVPAPNRKTTVLPEGTLVQGVRLTFLDVSEPEVRYRGLRGDQMCLVREAPVGQAEALRFEQVLLERLHHPILPELLQAFEHEDYCYLVTAFPAGIRLDQKVATQTLSEAAVHSLILVLYDLLVYLDETGVHLDLSPAHLVRTPGGRLLLIDLRATRRSQRYPGLNTPGTLAEDLAGLGRCLQFWLPHPKNRQVIDALLAGRCEREALLAAADPDTTAALVPVGSSVKRVPAPDGSAHTCLPAGTQLAGYEVTFYARGGMSMCYLGKLGSDVRFLKEVKVDNTEAAEALRREFTIMKGLKHPSLVRAHLIFELGGYFYLVTDFIEGSTLAGPASEEQLLDYADQLCEALGYLHSRTPPLIYRDLKPSNVVRSPDGKLHLIDFGLARTYRAGQEKDTQALGTFSTASPEHFSGQTDARSDIFSLGATLYLLACPGFRPSAPFRFPPVRQQRPDLSEGFEQLLKRCFETAPEARWQTTQTLRAEVKKLAMPFRSQVNEEPVASDWVEDLRHLPNLPTQVATGARQLADHVGEGLAPPEAMRAVSQACEIPCLARLWETAAATGMEAYPQAFPPSYVELVKRGEFAEGAALLEKESLARRTRSTPTSDTNPLETIVRPTVSRGALAGLAAVSLGAGAAAAASLAGVGLPPWQPVLAGLGATGGVGLVAVFVRAVRDARELRVRGKAQTLVEDAWTSYALGETEKAEAELTQALALAHDKLGVGDLTTLTSLHSLANLCRQRRAYEKAEGYYQQAETIYARLLPENHTARAILHHHRALNFLGSQNQEQALRELDRASAIWGQHAELHPLELAEVQFTKARVHFDREENEEALDLFSKSLELQYAALGLKSPLVHTSLSYLTRVYVRLRLFKESERHLATLLAEASQTQEPNYPALAEANLDMGLVRIEQARLAEAEPYFLRALQILQHYVGPHDRLLRRVLDGYRRVLGERAELEAGSMKLLSLFLGEREKLRQSLERHPEWVNARDNTGWGPIQWATFIGREDIVRLLLHRGADPGYDASHVMGPLHVACAWNRPEAMFALLEKDPDVDAGGPGGWTPAFWCALNGQTKLLEHLIRRGANVNALDDQGQTPLHIAASHNRLRALATLIGAGARVDAKTALGGQTALHMAAERGHLAICDCLIFNKAHLGLGDNAGQEPLDLAEQNGHKLVARALRNHLQAGLGGGSATPRGWRRLVGFLKRG